MRPKELQEGWSGGREGCKMEKEMCDKKKQKMFAMNGTKNIKGREVRNSLEG